MSLFDILHSGRIVLHIVSEVSWGLESVVLETLTCLDRRGTYLRHHQVMVQDRCGTPEV